MKARTNNRFLVVALVAGLGLILAGPAFGRSSTWTWDGSGADNLWTDSANWLRSTGGYPHTGDTVQFGGSFQLNPYNNNSGLEVSEIDFNVGSGAFTLSGNAISVGGAGGIVNDSAANQMINMPVILTAAETFKPTSGALGFSMIDGAHPLTFSGGYTVYLFAPVGAATPLSSLIAYPPVAVSGGLVATTGAQTYETTLALDGDALLQSDSASITVLGTVLGDGNTSGNDLTIQTPTTVVLNGATALGSLLVTSGTATLSGSFSSLGSQNYSTGGTVTLAGDTLMQSSGSGIIVGPVAGNSYKLTLTTPAAATLTGATGLGSLLVTSGTTTLSGTVSSTGGQNYSTGGTVALGGNTVLQSGTASVTLGGPVLGYGNNLTVLASSGTSTLTGATGLGSLLVSSSITTLSGTVSSTGGQNYSTGGTVSLGGNTVLQSGTASVTLGGLVLGYGNNLTVLASSGTATLTGATGLGSLLVSSSITTLSGTVSSTGGQNYSTGGTVALGGNTLLQSGTASVILGGPVAGNGHNLTVLASSGTVALTGATGLGSLLVTSGTATLSGTLSAVSATFSAAVNNSAVIVANGGMLTFNGPLVNNGSIYALNGSVVYGSSVVNNGTIITSDCLPNVTDLQVVGPDVQISFTTCSGVSYVVAYATDPVGGTWTTLPSVTGTGSIMSVNDSGAAALPQRFYRAGVIQP